jgi:hypothetical protein
MIGVGPAVNRGGLSLFFNGRFLVTGRSGELFVNNIMTFSLIFA